jgi:hypothetical protein
MWNRRGRRSLIGMEHTWRNKDMMTAMWSGFSWSTQNPAVVTLIHSPLLWRCITVGHHLPHSTPNPVFLDFIRQKERGEGGLVAWKKLIPFRNRRKTKENMGKELVSFISTGSKPNIHPQLLTLINHTGYYREIMRHYCWYWYRDKGTKITWWMLYHSGNSLY